jgi:hypothetical protein
MDEHTYSLYVDCLPEWNIPYIALAQDETGLVFYSVRTMCQGIGIDSPTQTGIIRGDAGLKAESREIKLPAASERARGLHATLCLSKKGVAMWLAHVQTSRTGNAQARERIEQYQHDLWNLATRLVFSRKRIADASVEDAGEIVQVTGTERLEIECECGMLHVLEKHDGTWRHFVMSKA